eukprot:SAG25_NODE_232_length_11380_cov_15.425583_2_plen_220_part_00
MLFCQAAGMYTGAHLAGHSIHSAHDAVEVGTREDVLRLLSGPGGAVAMASTNQLGQDLMQSAAWYGRAPDILRTLAQEFKCPLYSRWTCRDAKVATGHTISFVGAPTISLAAGRGHATTVRALHGLGLSVVAKDSRGWLPAHYAAAAGNAEALRVIHELAGSSGALAALGSAAEDDGRHPVHLAAVRHQSAGPLFGLSRGCPRRATRQVFACQFPVRHA